MRTIQYDTLGVQIFSTLLLWWGTIREHYKETNNLSIYLDMAHDNLLNRLFVTEIEMEN